MTWVWFFREVERRMDAALIAGTSNQGLASAVAAELELELTPGEIGRHPDGEIRVRVSPALRGRNVFVVQATGPPVHGNLFELLMLADACRRVGAARITAVVPYLGYSRADRPGAAGRSVGLRVVADALQASPVDRLVVVDPHIPALESVFAMPLETLTAIPVLASQLKDRVPEDAVVVAPDLGAVKLAEKYAALLHKPIAIIRKTRVSGESVQALGLVGDVRGRTALLVDDMISTGATVEAAVWMLLDCGARAEMLVAATHGVLSGAAAERLGPLPLETILLTDSLALNEPMLPIEVASIAPLIAEAIDRLHRDRPLDDLQLYR